MTSFQCAIKRVCDVLKNPSLFPEQEKCLEHFLKVKTCMQVYQLGMENRLSSTQLQLLPINYSRLLMEAEKSLSFHCSKR